MAKKSTRKHAPFIDRVVNKLTKTQEWLVKMKPRFTTEPKGVVLGNFADIEEQVAATLDNLGKLNGWAPPSRGPAFAIGDEVAFKKEKLAELKKSALYSDVDLTGKHEVIAVDGRKVKLNVGIFANLYVTKAA